MSNALRFVVLHHTDWANHPDHFDVLLQLAPGRDDDDRVLKAFATRDNFFPAAGSKLSLNDDHRRAYLNFEGAISGGRGRVVRVDAGTLTWLHADPHFKILLSGSKLSGTFCIREIVRGDFVLEEISDAVAPKAQPA